MFCLRWQCGCTWCFTGWECELILVCRTTASEITTFCLIAFCNKMQWQSLLDQVAAFDQEGVLVLDHSMVCRVGNCYWKTCIVEQKSHELGAYASVRRHTDAMLIYSVSLQVQQMLYIRRALMIIADIEVYTQGTHNSSGSWYHVAVRSNLLYATYLIKWRISCKMKCTWAWQSPGLGGPWVVRRISEGIVKHVKKKYR